MNEWPEDSGFGAEDLTSPASEVPSQPAARTAQPPPPPPGAPRTQPLDAAAQRMAHFDSPATPTPFDASPGVQPASPHYVEANTKKSKLPWIIGGVVVLLFVLLAGAVVSAFLFVRSGQDVLEDFAESRPEIATPSEPDTGFLDGSSPAAEDTVSIDVGSNATESFDGELSPNGFDSFVLELEAGDSLVVSAEANGSSLDTVLVAVGPAGNQVASNDDADFFAGLGGDLDSQVEFVADSSGAYTFEVVGFNEADEGAYVLTVERSN